MLEEGRLSLKITFLNYFQKLVTKRQHPSHGIVIFYEWLEKHFAGGQVGVIGEFDEYSQHCMTLLAKVTFDLCGHQFLFIKVAC